MAKINDARRAVTRARTVLLVNNPFWGTLALQLKLVEVADATDVNTMAVDGVNMFFHPPFVLGLGEDELVGVVAHEVMHCALKHMVRRGNRQPKIWNIANDYVINLDIIEAGFKLPGKPSFQHQKGDTSFHYCYDPKYKGWSSEDVYEDLMQNVTVVNVSFSIGDGSGADPGGCGGVRDAPDSRDDPTKAAEVAASWDANVRMAISVARGQMAGKLPGYMERFVKELKRPRVNWRDITRNFIDASMTKDFSWARPSRRAIACGLLMPGYVADRMNECVFAVDTSGSIDEKLLTSFLSEVAGALNEGIADKLTVVYADDGVRHVDTFMQGDIVSVSKMHGGGGTNFDPTFDWIEKNCPDAGCIIYLTDLMTGGYGKDLGIPTMWATYLPDHYYAQAAAAVPFGTPIHVSNGTF